MPENDVYLVVDTQGQPARRSRRYHPIVTPTPVQTPSTTVGFTDNAPVAGYQTFYVANHGSDETGLGTEQFPFSTIYVAMMLAHDNTPYRIYLNRGDSWELDSRGLDILPSGSATDGMALMTYYGDTSLGRPILMADGEIYRNDRNVVHDIGFIGVEFYGHYKDPDNAAYDGSKGSPNLRFIGYLVNMHVEDCKFRYCRMTAQSYSKTDSDTDITTIYSPHNIVLHRNIFDTTYVLDSSNERDGASNVFLSRCQGLTATENSFDYGGWHETIPTTGANLLSHNVYIQHSCTDVVFNKNICSRAASHGAQFRSGGEAIDNFAGRCAIGFLMGYNYGGREIPDSHDATMAWNVVSEGESMYKGGGGDFCTADNVCSGALWGLEWSVNSDANYRNLNNVVSGISPNNYTGRTYVQRSLHLTDDAPYVDSGNVYHQFSNDTENNEIYGTTIKTLGDYNESLGGSNSYDEFMDRVNARLPGEWYPADTAPEINKFIRAHYNKVKPV